jgi:uroporphyrinogen-III synthase
MLEAQFRAEGITVSLLPVYRSLPEDEGEEEEDDLWSVMED